MKKQKGESRNKMEEIQVNTLEINGKNYFLVDSITENKNTYHFFAELTNPNSIQVLKEKTESDDTYYVSLDTESEFDYALALFYDKYHENSNLNSEIN